MTSVPDQKPGELNVSQFNASDYCVLNQEQIENFSADIAHILSVFPGITKLFTELTNTAHFKDRLPAAEHLMNVYEKLVNKLFSLSYY